MIRRLWLVFCQTATVCVAALFVVSTLRPDLLSSPTGGSVVTIREAPPQGAATKISSFSDAARVAMPAVVNVCAKAAALFESATAMASGKASLASLKVSVGYSLSSTR